MEIWKDINGLEGRYQVSSLGRVKNISRFVYSYNAANKQRKIPERILKQPLNIYGYPTVHIRTKGFKRGYTIHRFVAKAFIENPKNLPCVNHKNGIKTDNMVENLEWCTASENELHAYKTGLKKPRTGTDMYNVKLNNASVLLIRASSESSYKLAAKYGVSQGVIMRIKHRQTWKHI